MKLRRAALLLAAALALFGTWQVASAVSIHARAFVAQELLAFAWSRADDRDVAPRPWPWADMRPVARLDVPSRHIRVIVLDDAHPRALAFGPGHVAGTAQPGAAGNSVIVAHRDTHFAFLRRLAVDDEIDVEGARGSRSRYRVREVAIVDKHQTEVLDAADSSRLTLITCWPFDAVRPGTPLRYVVIADRVA